MIPAVIVLLSGAALCFLARLIKGPTLADRIVALDGILTCVLGGVAVAAVEAGSNIYLGALLVVSLLGFVGTSVAARFIEERGA